MKFWDSSAVVPLIVDEPDRERLAGMLRADGGLIVWWGTPVECMSALARRERDGDLTVDALDAALERLRALEAAWVEVLPSATVRRVAVRLLRTHVLRAADSLQLAAALVAAEEKPDSLGFVCLDDRLTAAARREGFASVL